MTQLQIALDVTDLDLAIEIASKAVEGGADVIEAGTPLIKSFGMESVRQLALRFKDSRIVADMKTADAGYLEAKMAVEAGADVTTVLASASQATISEAVRAASEYDLEVMADLIDVNDRIEYARRMEALGVDCVCVHSGIDELGESLPAFDGLKCVVGAIKIPVAAAGGINAGNVRKATDLGASIVIIGRAITTSPDVVGETVRIKRMLREP